MTRKWSNLNLPGALHYVTGNVLNRLPIFTNANCCRAFIKELDDLNRSWPAKLIAYVLMLDHVHLISNPRDGRIKEFTRALKSLSARRIVEMETRFDLRKSSVELEHQVWQESFKAIPLWSGWMIWQKINYIHANPVKAGLVKSARDYPWSSFSAYYTDSRPLLGIDREWWWEDDAEKLSKAMKDLGWLSYYKRLKKSD